MIKKELLIGISIVVVFLYLNYCQSKKIEKMSNIKDNEILKLEKNIKKQNKMIEKFTTTNYDEMKKKIGEEINNLYQIDLDAIRNLSKISTRLQNEGLTIPGNLKVSGNLDVGYNLNILPRGTIVAYYSTTIPSGWAYCNGEIVKVKKIDGTEEEVQTPDLRGRFIYGWGLNKGSTFKLKGGSETHKLEINEIPSHNHGGATNEDGTHKHSFRGNFGVSAGIGRKDLLKDDDKEKNFNRTQKNLVQPDSSSKHSHVINNEGGSMAHNNMPPFMVLVYIMKL